MESENIDTSEIINEQNLTKQQKKNKKKRDAAKKKKQDQGNGIIEETSKEIPNLPQVVSEKNVPTNDEADNFEEELSWCVQQIQLGLQTQKPLKDQLSKSKKLMDQLKSKKTPKPKKRMLMRTNFGDYREKMEKERKQLKQVKPAKFVDVDDKVIKKSIFFRKKVDDLPLTTCDQEQEFRFNFSDPT